MLLRLVSDHSERFEAGCRNTNEARIVIELHLHIHTLIDEWPKTVGKKESTMLSSEAVVDVQIRQPNKCQVWKDGFNICLGNRIGFG